MKTNTQTPAMPVEMTTPPAGYCWPGPGDDRKPRPAPQAAPAASTPTPWEISQKFGDCSIIGGDGHEVCDTSGCHLSESLYRPEKHWANIEGCNAEYSEEQEHANAELIVLAVNERAGLLAEVAALRVQNFMLLSALGRLVEIVDSGEDLTNADFFGTEMNQARAALAQK